ncbi:unnamed protein product [Closterium sp. NIES-53]
MATTTVLRQRQPSVQESLSPQQLREWAIWWGSPSGRASRARAGGAGAGGPRTLRREPLSSQQLCKRAVWWGSPGGGAWCATTGGPCESVPAGSAAGRHGGSGGGQQWQQRPPETLSLQQLREWAVWWGSPGGGAWGTSAGGGEAPGGVEATSLGAFDSASTGAEPEEALHTFTVDSGASRCFFRDSTTVTPLTVPVPVTLVDPSGARCVLLVSSPHAPNSPLAPPSWPPLLPTPSWHALPSPCLWASQVPAPAPKVACAAVPLSTGVVVGPVLAWAEPTLGSGVRSAADAEITLSTRARLRARHGVGGISAFVHSVVL